jgi:hypothetical protein
MNDPLNKFLVRHDFPIHYPITYVRLLPCFHTLWAAIAELVVELELYANILAILFGDCYQPQCLHLLDPKPLLVGGFSLREAATIKSELKY